MPVPQVYIKISTAVTAHSPIAATYTLRRYPWRTLLGIAGPLCFLGFYAHICYYYLDKQPIYGILLTSKADATPMFYAWFVISIFSLDWARTALANFEAAALMHPWLAPPNASELFWHADNNWANPLWWLRFLRNGICGNLYFRKPSDQNSAYKTKGKFLWILLSLVSVVFFSAVPLSGLTMELSPVLRPTSRKSSILGPGPDSYNQIGNQGLAQIIAGIWRLGGNTTPSDVSYFFAAEGTEDVSLTYYEDMARSQVGGPITTFLGPAVNEEVSGIAFGTKTEFYCRQVPSRDLKLVGATDDPSTNYTVMLKPLDEFPHGISTLGLSGVGVSDFA
ncbi:uncharacterized protein AB675_3702 [Cyphellophora attinorum]|uniref:Uncharacterized protein n=1 Tax=Cyphellophora attinorum TaxID=1664694 RepID=A0A0N1HK87_9EURO|nr:uncharacterized protein AB675_3702 [Phialophora attinorum]KPI37127.1 hypothetical protein AB675_3702 [Phialophora attinorum]